MNKERRQGEAEISLLSYLIDRSRNAIDVGANKGVYTHVISQLARHTYAYEPNPKMFRLLQRNIGKGVTASQVQTVACLWPAPTSTRMSSSSPFI